jgi:hypothetical protein
MRSLCIISAYDQLTDSVSGILTLQQARRPGGGEVDVHSSTLSLTSALDGVGGQRHVPAALSSGKNWYPLHRRLGGPQD